MGPKAPYGYERSPSEKHSLVPDPDVAPTVKRIFKLFAQGDSGRHIASILNNEGVPSPSIYYYNKLGKTPAYKTANLTWCSSTIMQLLKNRVYKGDMVQGKRKNVSFKTKDRKLTSSDEWIIVEGTHEALIDNETWNEVERRVTQRIRTEICHKGEISLFSGIARCADCGAAMVFTTRRYKGTVYQHYRCSRYVNHGKEICSIHAISLGTLEEAVFADIQANAKLAASDRETLLLRLMSYGNREQDREKLSLEKKVCTTQNRLIDLENLIQKLFEERCAGNVPDSIFKKLMHDYEAEQKTLQETLKANKSALSAASIAEQSVSDWTDRLERYAKIDALSRSVVVELIDSISVSECIEQDGSKSQNININYKFDRKSTQIA